MRKIFAFVIVLCLVVIGVGGWFIVEDHNGNSEMSLPGKVSEAQSPVLINQVDYQCDEGKTISAKYYKGPEVSAPEPGEPPTPTGSVELVLSDGRQMTLPQTISASGIRYANSDESFIFWSKGDGAFVMEGEEQTYSNCAETK